MFISTVASLHAIDLKPLQISFTLKECWPSSSSLFLANYMLIDHQITSNIIG